MSKQIFQPPFPPPPAQYILRVQDRLGWFDVGRCYTWEGIPLLVDTDQPPLTIDGEPFSTKDNNILGWFYPKETTDE